FLDAAEGGEWTYEHFERKPEKAMSLYDIAEFGSMVTERLARWWSATATHPALETLATYYGQKSRQDVLERTAWHTAQHTRQLMQLLENAGISPNEPLTDEDLAGLPLPTEIYDDQVQL
ncbi:MAG: hypothetical protein RIC38_04270, partial [Chromatocurvus sp.]